jgi:hypothetical protein
VPVSYDFARSGTVAVVAEPGDSAVTAHFAFVPDGRLTITYDDSTVKTFRYLLDGRLLTLDQNSGPRYIFRRAP